MLEIKEISKKFGDFQVLDKVSLSADKGQILGLVGSNGSGKTTLLKHIMKVYQEDSGQIIYQGNSLKADSKDFADFYYVQDDLFFPQGSSLKSLFEEEKLFYKNISEEKFLKLVEYFKADLNQKLSSMSKGQKKQAAFILAMVVSPKVLLLDEIVDGLDAVIRRKFWNVLIKEVEENEITVIISSHDLKELDNICDKIAIMHQGKVIKEEKMDILKEELKRIQFAVQGEFYEDVADESFTILRKIKVGSVYFITLQGDADTFEEILRKEYNVLLFNHLSVSLEEIFITELGGSGYGNEEYSE